MTPRKPSSARGEGPSEPLRLGDLQLAILRVLWDQGEATVTEVHGVVGPARGSAASTIATMLSKMEARRLVTHHKVGRQFVYTALVEEDSARRSMVEDIKERMFGGDPLELLSHLVREEELGTDDLSELRALIAKKVKESRRGGR
ncbi:MAG: BlaI/MecI/CopY family transcriptional regulator [Planctomycetota bacterium]